MKCFFFYLALTTSPFLALASDICEHFDQVVKAARSTSVSTVVTTMNELRDDDYAFVLLSGRRFELDTSKATAEALLQVLPTNKTQYWRWAEHESCAAPVKDLLTVGNLFERLPRLFARAVGLSPQRLQQYIAFSAIVYEDPHNDYIIHMQVVCRRNPEAFRRVLNSLPVDQGTLISTRVFNPQNCRAIAIPER